MIGEINRNDYISAGGAQVNDDLLLVVDFNGKIGKASKLYYDTTTFKSSEEVLEKRKAMIVLSKRHIANASKDISNGGIFGTIMQMIKYSEVGADINVNDIKIPPILIDNSYDLETYIKMYLTTSFIITTPNNYSHEAIEIFKQYRMNAQVIGKITEQKNLLKINNGTKSIDVIRF
jgi:selenophosphate synthetase-related protein